MFLNVFQLTDFLLNNLNSFLIGLNTLIGIIIFIRMMAHSRQELKTAPRYNIFQKASNFFGAFSYSLMVSLTVVFIIALISSMIAVNALYYINNFRREFANYNQLIATFQYPVFLPTILVLMAAFAVFYSLLEYLLMAQPSQDAPMEIQRWIEKTFIDRFRPPWSYLVAFIIFVVIVLLAPFITARLSLQLWTNFPPNAKIWLIILIFMSWIMLGPIFYLSYYSQIGIVQAYFRGRKINKKKDKKGAFFYYIALLGIFMTVYSFIKILILIFDARPDTALNPLDAQGDFWPIIFKFIKERSGLLTQEQIQAILAFFAIFPLGFSSFILTTIIFGLVGFYAKFLSKEPLNTPKMILFAAYIITGIAFSIFINTIVNFPYTFPTQFLNSIGFPLTTRNINDQILLLRIFAIPLLMEKTINLIFLINFLFLNKSLKQQMEKLVLNQAITNEDFEIFQKYLNHRDPSIRLKLFIHLVDYINLDPTMTDQARDQLSNIFERFIFDEDPNINQMFIENSAKITDLFTLSSQLNLCYRLIAKESPQSINMGFNLLKIALPYSQNLSDDENTQIFKVMKKIVLKSYNPQINNSFTEFLSNFRRSFPILTRKLIISFIQATPRFEILLGLNFISQFPKFVQSDKDIIILSIQNQLKKMDLEIIKNALHAYIRFALVETSLIPQIMTEFNQITLNEEPIIQEKIGGIVQFNLIHPEWFEQFFEYLRIYLEDSNISIKSDALIACGTLASPVNEFQFFNSIYPYFLQNIQSETIEIRKAVISSLIVIAQTRPDIYNDPRFHKLFTFLIVDPRSEIRHQVYRFFIDGDPEYIVRDIANLLETPISIGVRVDLLNILSQIVPSVIPYVDDIDLYRILMEQPFSNQENEVNMSVIQELQEDKTSLFGFRNFQSSFNLYDSIVALMYDLTYYIPEKYHILVDFYQKHQKLENDFSLAKKIEFYSKIIYEELSLTRTVGITFTLVNLIELIHQSFSKIQYHSTHIIIQYISKLLKVAPGFHKELFDIGYNLISFKSYMSDSDKGTLLVFFTEIITHSRGNYIQPITIPIFLKSKQITLNPFEKVLKPFLLFCMKNSHKQMENFIMESLQKMMTDFSDISKIQDFLVHIIHHSHDSEVKISAMKFFTSLPIEIKNRKNILLILNQLRSKDDNVKAQAIESIGIILRAFPTVNPDEKGPYSSYAKVIRDLLYNAFYSSYSITAPIQIRATIIAHLKTILLIQPHFPVSLKILDQLSQEPDEVLAIQAVSLLFDFVDFHKEKLSEELVILHHYSNSPFASVQKIMSERIAGLFNEKVHLNVLFPIIFNLTTSDFPEIRQMVFNTIFLLFNQEPTLLPQFFYNLQKLTKQVNYEIRYDSFELLTKIVNILSLSEDLIGKFNETLLRLSMDPEMGIKIFISQNLVHLIHRYPQHSSEYLHIISDFIRLNNSEIVKNIIPACKAVIQVNQEFKPILEKRIKKVFKKTQNPFIDTLLKEIS